MFRIDLEQMREIEDKHGVQQMRIRVKLFIQIVNLDMNNCSLT